MDTVTSEKRSAIMRSIHGKNTKPELAVRKLVYGLGYRYRLHSKNLPGKPDLVFKSRKKAIFVHGCFWHQHENCKVGKHIPKSRLGYWGPKLEGNKKRDSENRKKLNAIGWQTLTIWACEIKDENALKDKIVRFLNE